MGGTQTHPCLTEEVLEDYSSLTYLCRGEILYLMKKFESIDPEKFFANFHHRFNKEDIIQKFNVLQNNPFGDRLFHVFSSKQDDCFSFEDLLDLCSAMSADCPSGVKAAWAFRIYDLDDDNQISVQDICGIIDRLTLCQNSQLSIDKDDQIKIANIILDEMKLGTSGSIGMSEFKYIMARFPEFEKSFYFRL